MIKQRNHHTPAKLVSHYTLAPIQRFCCKRSLMHVENKIAGRQEYFLSLTSLKYRYKILKRLNEIQNKA